MSIPQKCSCVIEQSAKVQWRRRWVLGGAQVPMTGPLTASA